MIITNNKNLPQEFVKTIKCYPPKPERMSVTHLIDEPLIRTLQIECWDDIIVDASDYVLMMLGISFHKQMENESDEYSEKKYEDLIDGMTLVGKADLYNPTENRINFINYKSGGDIITEQAVIPSNSISDWKVTSVWTLIYKDRIKEWEKQLNVYAFQHRLRNLQVDKLQIHCILRDWSERQAQREKDCPKNNFVTINIPLWTFEEQERYVKEQLEFHAMNPREECSSENKWEKTKVRNLAGQDVFIVGSVYAVESPKKTMRVLPTRKEAEQWLSKKGKPDYKIVERAGIPKRCVKYCSVRSVCPFVKGD